MSAAGGLFRSILSAPRGISALKEMHETGLLGSYIPEFETLRRQVQHDAYHIYTTDVHSLFTFSEIKKFLDGSSDPKLKHLMSVADELEDSYALLLAGLFHDIGKG